MHCQRALCDYLHLLERWKIEYTLQSPEDDPDNRFVEACQMMENENHLLDVLMFAELEQRVRTVDMLLKDGTIGKISENRFARVDLEHILLCVDDDMWMEALRQTNYVISIVTA